MSDDETIWSRNRPINLADAAAGLTELWSPRVAARINDLLVKVVKVHGEFVWHNHPDTDEAFLVLSGRLVIDIRDGIPSADVRWKRPPERCSSSREASTTALSRRPARRLRYSKEQAW